MNKQTLAVIVGAIVLFGLAVFGAMAFTGGDSSPGGTTHIMDDGSVMTDPMETTDATP